MATATTIGPKDPAFISHIAAGEDLTGDEGLAVEVSSSGWTVANSAGEKAFPLAVGAASGSPVSVAVPGCVVPVKAGAAISINAYLTCTAAGLWATATTGQIATVIALEAAGASGDFILGLVCGPVVAP